MIFFILYLPCQNQYMNLAHALRLDSQAATISLVGAGGKTTALFQIARQLLNQRTPLVLVTNTTHLGAWQTSLADHHIIALDENSLADIFKLHGVVLITGHILEDRAQPIEQNILSWLHKSARGKNIHLLIEADGSRQHPLKAPAEHEPPIPEFSDLVVLVAGMSGLGKPLNNESVHRAEIFSQLSGLPMEHEVTPQSLINSLNHPQGGLKNIPPTSRRVVILNQADTPELQSLGGSMSKELLINFDSVIVSSLENNQVQPFESCAGIILAAGQASRFGSVKQLLDWKGKPFIRQVTETALRSGLWPVVVITGAYAADVESAIQDLPVHIVQNPNFALGQSTSIKTGINFLSRFSRQVGSAIFLLADQPQIPVEVVRALTESHARTFSPITAPLVLNEGRANPVLFDRVTFPDLLELSGDIGGRAIFGKYKVEYLPWHDDRLLLDVDKPEDYQRLVEDETL